MSNWKINEAKAKFSELVKQGQLEPQTILNRDKKLGVFISYEYYCELIEAKKKSERPSLKEMVEEIINLDKKEDFPPVKRNNRKTWVD